MIHACTVSDINYLDKGLALYKSISEKDSNITLHYLCIDQKSYDILSGINDDHLIPYRAESLLKSDAKLKRVKEENYKYYCWSLASYFSHFILSKLGVDVTYIDSDIYFHQPLSKLIEEVGEKEVAIFRHRQFPLETPRPEGWFNVGVVHFKNTKIAKRVLKWWSKSVLNKSHPELATCGDQRYLDHFLKMVPKDKLFADEHIGHGAPWQWQLYDMSSYKEDGCIIWEGSKQLLYFTHFSQFFYKEDCYVPSAMHHIYTPLEAYDSNPDLKSIYDNYYIVLKGIRNAHNI